MFEENVSKSLILIKTPVLILNMISGLQRQFQMKLMCSSSFRISIDWL